MRYRVRDANGDYSFGQGSQNFLVNSQATVAQAILTALNLDQGEWFLDQTAGVPYFSGVLGYGTQGIYDSILKAAVLSVQGVVSVINYSSNLNRTTRQLSVSMLVETQFGQAQIQTILSPFLPRVRSVIVGYGAGGYGTQPYGA